jgi:hypothetical protein
MTNKTNKNLVDKISFTLIEDQFKISTIPEENKAKQYIYTEFGNETG